MFQADTYTLSFAGTPEGTRRVAFQRHDTSGVVAMVRGIEEDWDHSVFIETEFDRTFFVASSPNGRNLVVQRWLNGHTVVGRSYATKTAQKADLDGKDAGTLSHEEIVDALKDALTADDKPVAIPAEVDALTLVPAEPWDREAKQGDYKYSAAVDTPAVPKPEKVEDLPIKVVQKLEERVEERLSLKHTRASSRPNKFKMESKRIQVAKKLLAKAMKKALGNARERPAVKRKARYVFRRMKPVRGVLVTKGTDESLTAAFRSDDNRQLFLLHDMGSDWMLENLQAPGYRREHVVAKADVSGDSLAIVTAMIPNLRSSRKHRPRGVQRKK